MLMDEQQILENEEEGSFVLQVDFNKAANVVSVALQPPAGLRLEIYRHLGPLPAVLCEFIVTHIVPSPFRMQVEKSESAEGPPLTWKFTWIFTTTIAEVEYNLMLFNGRRRMRLLIVRFLTSRPLTGVADGAGTALDLSIR